MIFSPQWFTRHQKILLWFANSWIGRRILCINGNRSSVGKNKIIKILPNSITWKVGNKYSTEFRISDMFARRIYRAFYPLWKLCHLWDMVWYPNFNLGFDTLTKTGQDDVFEDGIVGYNTTNPGLTFANLKGQNGNEHYEVSGADQIYLAASTTSNQYNTLRCMIYHFDTSSLTGAVNIDSAVFSVYGSAKVNNLGSPDFHIGSSSPASDSVLADADFQTRGSTSFGSKAYADYSTTGWNDITLNASGIANISKTGTSKFSGQFSWDILNSTTGLTWASAAQAQFGHYFCTVSGKEPKLVVTYTLPMGGYIFISS